MSNSAHDGQPNGMPDHLDDLVDGLGCVEIWEELSEQRADDA